MLVPVMVSLLLAAPPPAQQPAVERLAAANAALRNVPPQLMPKPPPPACSVPMPRPRAGPAPFPTGEKLAYDVDVMGAKAGHMTFEVLPAGRGPGAEVPVHVSAESNTFFNKVRKINGEVTSWLRPKDLRPSHFHEDLVENALTRVADVVFGDKTADVSWTSNNNTKGTTRHVTGPDGALDYVGAIYLFRTVPLKVGQPFCFDVYAIKRIWRCGLFWSGSRP